jgi:hypothetical protein
MARLTLRQLRYEGDKYIFISPLFSNGVVIVEGENGAGKSTFSDLLYFAMGGNVAKFKREGRNKHIEVTSDTNNFVELTVEINAETFKFKRYIGINEIAVFSETEMIGVFPVFRSKDVKETFSDWVLAKIGIDGFNLYFSRYKGRISFSDLFRLIYHDQAQDADRIYKQHDNDGNLVSDSSAFRKAIFEILVGRASTEYYSALDELNKISKDLNEAKAGVTVFGKAIAKLGNTEDWNTTKISEELGKVESQLEKLQALRTSLRASGSSGDTQSVLSDLRNKLDSAQVNLTDTNSELGKIQSELTSLQELKRTLILEVTQIKKIIFTHEQLQLFSPDTCPYCLSQVHRPHGKCICASPIDEMQYERFFYSTAEYLGILKAKQRNVETVSTGIENCEDQIKALRTKASGLQQETATQQQRISSAVAAKALPMDFSKLDEIDNKIVDLRTRQETLINQLALERDRQSLEDQLASLESAKTGKQAEVDRLEAESRQQMHSLVDKFNEKYNALLKETVSNCRRAKIDDDYMPVINDGDYVEASAIVPKRLMYFLTLLSLSLEFEEINYPRFLLIDTPDTAGIDDDNLRKAIAKIPEVIGAKDIANCQVILTTGVDMYPPALTNSVILKITKADRLLKKRAT